jgi:hypothetical protein
MNIPWPKRSRRRFLGVMIGLDPALRPKISVERHRPHREDQDYQDHRQHCGPKVNRRGY